jgi:hypothetical protein
MIARKVHSLTKNKTKSHDCTKSHSLTKQKVMIARQSQSDQKQMSY